MKRYKVSVTTDGAGNAVAYTPRLSGEIHEIEYIKDGGANPFANGVDFTITSEATGKTLWAQADVNASASRRTSRGDALHGRRSRIVRCGRHRGPGPAWRRERPRQDQHRTRRRYQGRRIPRPGRLVLCSLLSAPKRLTKHPSPLTR
jgi:hypothetical protein